MDREREKNEAGCTPCSEEMQEERGELVVRDDDAEANCSPLPFAATPLSVPAIALRMCRSRTSMCFVVIVNTRGVTRYWVGYNLLASVRSLLHHARMFKAVLAQLGKLARSLLLYPRLFLIGLVLIFKVKMVFLSMRLIHRGKSCRVLRQLCVGVSP